MSCWNCSLNASVAKSFVPVLLLRGAAMTIASVWVRTRDALASEPEVAGPDGFTFNAISWLEGLGFCERGEGGAFVKEGHLRRSGDLPLNTDGGGLSSSHPGMRGIFLLIEDQFGVGDVVDLNGAVGTVEEMGLRLTQVRSFDGTLWYVRNGEIARVGNMSQEYAVARVEVPVALSADVERAEQVAIEAAEVAVADPSIADKVLGEPKMLGVQDLSADRLTLRCVPNRRRCAAPERDGLS